MGNIVSKFLFAYFCSNQVWICSPDGLGLMTLPQHSDAGITALCPHSSPDHDFGKMALTLLCEELMASVAPKLQHKL